MKPVVKRFGLVAMLALASTAILGAGSAFASLSVDRSTPPLFKAGSYPANVEGTLQGDLFTTSGGSVNCRTAEASFPGLQSSTNALIVLADYSNCSAFGIGGDSVDMNDCYLWYRTSSPGPGSLIFGTSGINCPPQSDGIKIVPRLFGATLCTVTIPPQTVGTMGYWNFDGSVYAFRTGNESDVEYTVSGGGGLCGPVGSYDNGMYRLDSILTA